MTCFLNNYAKFVEIETRQCGIVTHKIDGKVFSNINFAWTLQFLYFCDSGLKCM